ncbi:MAG: MBL fold metallo-hydrolase [Candidatus Komeilibacteria bacterium]|nr:MBL fold metallo-hydrolase [Candidatus Komeilibacteria bacterium]
MLSIHKSQNIKRGRLIIGVLAILIIAIFNTSARNAAVARWVFFDVGQGDGILIITPGGEQILIDGGPNNKIVTDMGSYFPFYDHTIELMILSHAHADHTIGLVEVAKRYHIKEALYPGDIENQSAFYTAWLAEIQSVGRAALAGQTYSFADGSRLEILHPLKTPAARPTDLNDTSVVARYCYLEVCLLLTGDLPQAGEKELMRQGLKLKADILKVGHHGSRDSSGEDFIEAVKPLAAVIQSGTGNSYGHPHAELLQRLLSHDIKILRNDESGVIEIVTDGYRWWLAE